MIGIPLLKTLLYIFIIYPLSVFDCH